jgi:hypothetical protein
MPPIFIIGDLHGHYDVLIRLLRDAGLIRSNLVWCGADATVCFVGDYVNRGEKGITVMDYIISLELQVQHLEGGGKIIPLLGNHEVVLLAAQRSGDRLDPNMGKSFYDVWRELGAEGDLREMTPEHIAWLTHLPAMVLLRNRLILHADATFYLRYGTSIEAVNQRFETLMRSYDPLVFSNWLRDFAEHLAFWGENGTANAREFLRVFGGTQIIHGHTTIQTMTGQSPEYILSPLVYAENLCINVDGAVGDGGKGFVYRLPDN